MHIDGQEMPGIEHFCYTVSINHLNGEIE